MTFFTFAQSAHWDTTYHGEGGYYSGTIQINVEQLNSYIYDFKTDAQPVASTGTCVTFTNTRIHKDEFEKVFIPYLTGEFCWFLELNKGKNYNIIINGKPLDFSSNIQQKEEFQIRYKKSVCCLKLNISNGQVHFIGSKINFTFSIGEMKFTKIPQR